MSNLYHTYKLGLTIGLMMSFKELLTSSLGESSSAIRLSNLPFFTELFELVGDVGVLLRQHVVLCFQQDFHLHEEHRISQTKFSTNIDRWRTEVEECVLQLH